MLGRGFYWWWGAGCGTPPLLFPVLLAVVSGFSFETDLSPEGWRVSRETSCEWAELIIGADGLGRLILRCSWFESGGTQMDAIPTTDAVG